MSDYMFMLDSHLNSEQSAALSHVQEAAASAGVSLFLTGGAMRDMLGGFRIRDLDFTVEGNAVKIGRALAKVAGVTVIEEDPWNRHTELLFPGGVTLQVAMAHDVQYARQPGARPKILPATIQEDLRRRDFSVNAIALSLNRASRGLLLDPANGLADLGRQELRVLASIGFFGDPVRLLRLIRLRHRLGYTIEERTLNSYRNAREAGYETAISAAALHRELEALSGELNFAEIVKALDDEGLLKLFSPALTGAKLNLAGLQKLEKGRRVLPEELNQRYVNLGPLLSVATEKLSPKERAAFAKKVELNKVEMEIWSKLDQRSKKLENALNAPSVRRPSQIYHLLEKARPDEMVFLLYKSAKKAVQERIKNYWQRYLPMVQEIPDAVFEAAGAVPGAPKYAALRADVITKRLNAKPPKPEPELVPALPAPPQPPQPFARRGSPR